MQWITYSVTAITLNPQQVGTKTVSLPMSLSNFYGRFPGSRQAHIIVSTLNPTNVGFDIHMKNTGTNSNSFGGCFVLVIGS